MKEKLKFSVIFGSHARGDFNENSDFDVLLVGMEEWEFDLSVVPAIVKGKVDFVSYSSDDFIHFYNNGSLFIHHIFNQGVMVYGNAHEWKRLKESFFVKKDFSRELGRISSAAKLIKKTSIFGGKYLTPLSNIYTELKNACIFSLAHHGVYEFSKNRCFKLAIPSHLYETDLEHLKLFYNYVVREQGSLPFNPNDREKAEFLLESSTNSIEWLTNDCRSKSS